MCVYFIYLFTFQWLMEILKKFHLNLALGVKCTVFYRTKVERNLDTVGFFIFMSKEGIGIN